MSEMDEQKDESFIYVIKAGSGFESFSFLNGKTFNY